MQTGWSKTLASEQVTIAFRSASDWPAAMTLLWKHTWELNKFLLSKLETRARLCIHFIELWVTSRVTITNVPLFFLLILYYSNKALIKHRERNRLRNY